MSTTEVLLTVAVVALGTILTRALPFFIFPEGRAIPGSLGYLGRVLPFVIMSTLVVFSLKDVDITQGNRGLPELIAVVFVAVIQRWRHNLLLSIGGGTLLYMVLVQVVFK